MFYMVGDQRLCDARHYLGICCLRRRWCSGSVGSAAHGSVLSKIDLHRGNDIPRPRDRTPKIAFRPETVSAETKTQPQKPANCGLLGSLREISRLGRMRGGPERTRTACQARSPIEPPTKTAPFVGFELRACCGTSGPRAADFSRCCNVPELPSIRRP